MAQGISGQGCCLREKRNEIERLERSEEQKHAEHEAEIADAVNDEGFLAGVRRGFAEEIKTDEQVAREAHAFPADEEEDVIAGKDENKHEEHEEIEVGKETVVAAFVGHVAGGVDVDEPA